MGIGEMIILAFILGGAAAAAGVFIYMIAGKKPRGR